jgi:hypothetical protein
MEQKLLKSLEKHREQLTKEYDEIMPNWMQSRNLDNEFNGDQSLQARLMTLYSIIELIVRLIQLINNKNK